MATPAIQTLLADAQQVLNLNSFSEVRSTMAAALANANVGTPLNPNLTTQQLWDEFYLIVRQPESDIESIITNQLMKFLFAPPAPGGAGADQQVIFNDGGVLAGDPQFLWNKTTNLLTVTGSATITGDLTVDTSTLKVDSTNNRVGIGTATPNWLLTASGSSPEFVMIDSGANGTRLYTKTTNTAVFIGANYSTSAVPINFTLDGGSSNAMTLNSTGLGVGVASPSYKLDVLGSGTISGRFKTAGAINALYLEDSGTTAGSLYIGTSGDTFRIITGSNVRVNVDGSGNVGIGVTPSVWAAAVKALQIWKLVIGPGRVIPAGMVAVDQDPLMLPPVIELKVVGAIVVMATNGPVVSVVTVTS